MSGVVRRAGGGIEIDPLAIAAGGEVIVPDLAEASRGALGPQWTGTTDPIRAAIEHALGTLAEIPHRGMRHLPPGFGDRLRTARDRLLGVGLQRAAGAVETLRDRLGEEGVEAVEAWVDAYIRLSVTAESQ